MGKSARAGAQAPKFPRLRSALADDLSVLPDRSAVLAMDVAGVLPDFEPISGIRVLLVEAARLGNRLAVGIGRDFVTDDDMSVTVDNGTMVQPRYRH